VLAAHVAQAGAGEAEHASIGGKDLAQMADLPGDLKTHTSLTDGIVSVEGMIAAAEARGYEYYVVAKRGDLKTLALNLCTAHPELADDG
jgi:hypothetical protein